MEVAALALSAVDRIEKCIRGEIDRYKKFSSNAAVADELYDTVKRLKTQLVLLNRKGKELESKLSSEHDTLFLRLGASAVDEKLKSIQNRLEKESRKSQRTGKIREKTRRLIKAKGVSQMLNECKNDAVAVEHDMKEYYRIALQAQQAEASGAQGRDIPAQDCFRASFDVEKNPRHVVLHYDSMPRTGEEHDKATVAPEAQLKRAVLGASEADTIAAAVGSLGMGGVGKSCALRGLAVDEEVKRRFPDGVYMMVLGEKASKVDVVKGVSDMVKHSGGRKLAQDMWKERGDLREVLSRAGIWFQSRRILLLVDDVWENGEVRSSIVGQLHGSVVSGQSRLAFTTRHARLASEYETVKFGKRDQVVSREILLKAAGASVGSTGSFEGVVDGLLELCAGLPLALAIVGKGIAARIRYSSMQSWREAWAETLAAVSNRRNRLVVNRDYDYDKYSLEAVLESSLETLQDERRRRLGFEPDLSLHEMYRSLVVQKKQAALPVGVLRRLWGMDDEHDAKEAMNMFVEVSLAERRSVTLNGKDTACLSLHDLQHDFVQAKCKERGEEEQHHLKVLDGWWGGAGPSREVGGQMRRDWSGSEAFDDEYMRNNLSRHLVGGGLGGELRELMRNPRWTAKRLRRREMLGLEEDFGLAMASVESEGGAEERKGSGERERWGLEMICGAARLSAFFVGRNPGEVWFQLRGRLVGLAEKCGVIREFVEKIDGYAERPWARPTRACLSEPGGSVLSIVQCAGRVEDMRRGEREGEVRVCGVVEGVGFMCSVVDGEMEGEEVYVNKRAEKGCEYGCVGEDEGAVESGDESDASGGCNGSCMEESAGVEWSAVESVRYTADGGRVVTRHVNGTVRMWDGVSGEAMGGALGGGTCGGRSQKCEWSVDGSRVLCSGGSGSVRIWNGFSGEAVGGDERAHRYEVTCAEWSADGSRVLSGGDDGSVRIWDGASGHVVGGDERAHGSVFLGRVSCAKWSADGSRVVSGGADGSVRIWDGASGHVVGGHERAPGRKVTHVEWSADGSRFMCGAYDGSVGIWDGTSGEVVGGDECAHSKDVTCIKWSADGSRVVSGGLDGSVRIWDGASCNVVGGDEHARGGRVLLNAVKIIEWSPDGSRFASGAYDGSVRIWDSVSGKAVGGGECAHGRQVSCIKWSADGSRVVSGGLDGSVRVWNGMGGEAVSGDERAHGVEVSYVSWAADGSRFVCGGTDGSVEMWDEVSGEAVGGGKRAHSREVRCVEWSPDGRRVASVGADGSVTIWDGASGEVVGGDEHAHDGEVACVEWSADGGRVLSGGKDGSVRVWDAANGEVVGGDERAHGGGVRCAEWSPDGSRAVSGGCHGGVRIWDGASGEAVGGVEGVHRMWVTCVQWSPDGRRVVSGGGDGSVWIWDGASGETVRGEACAHCEGVDCVEWSLDGSRFVSGGGDGCVLIWDGESGEMVGGETPAFSDPVTCVEWSPDGRRFVFGGWDGSVRIWDGASGEAMGGVECAHRMLVTCVEWSPDGRRVVSGGGDGSVWVWDGTSCEMVGGEAHAHNDEGISVIEWSPHGSRCVSGGRDGSLRIWSVASGEAVGGGGRAHGGEVGRVEWSPDGNRVVSGGVDGSVRIWDAASGEILGGDDHAHGGGVRRVEWLPDGDRVVSSGSDGSVRMWHFASGAATSTELEACETRLVKRSHSYYPDAGTVNAVGLTSARDYGGEQITRLSGEEYEAGRWVAFDRSLELCYGGRKVLLATFEADYTQMRGAKFRNGKGAVVLGFLEDRSMYRVEIVK